MAKPKFFQTTDTATRIGEVIGSLLATGVFCLGGYAVTEVEGGEDVRI